MLKAGSVVSFDGAYYQLDSDTSAVRVPKPGAPVFVIGDLEAPGGERGTVSVCDGLVFVEPSKNPSGAMAEVRDDIPKGATVIDAGLGVGAPFRVWEQKFADGSKYGLAKELKVESAESKESDVVSQEEKAPNDSSPASIPPADSFSSTPGFNPPTS